MKWEQNYVAQAHSKSESSRDLIYLDTKMRRL